MHQFTPPPKPPTFDTDVASHRSVVEKAFKAGTLAVKAKPPRRGAAKPSAAAKKKVELFPSKWSAFKDVLSLAQHRKCAFCEGWAIGQGFGDVEHYAPKGAVEALGDDESTWGIERPNLANVIGRQTTPISATGYWWLAYDWDNYILACTICNQQWKKAIFPIKEPRAADPKHGDLETPYLLHPFRGEAPKDHLEYGAMGDVRPKVTPAGPSVYGRETIRTLGLDRPSLREQRRALASKIHKKLDALGGDASEARRRELLDDIRLEGAIDQPFCGMVRAIFEQRAGMRWAQLEAALGA